jgi:PAS domain S-box-containing protein
MDGIMRARLDGGQRSLGEDMRNTELVRRMTSGETSASFTTQSAPDGVQRIVSFRMVRGYPPAVSVAVSEVAVLAGVRRTSGHFVLAAALLSLLVLAAGALLIFGARRQERYAVNLSSSEQRLRESQARLNDSQQRLLDQHSALTELTRNDLLIRGDLQSVFARITEVAAKVMGAERVSIWRFANDPAALRCSDMYDSATGLHDSGVELKFEDFPIHFAALQRGELIAAADASTHPLTCELAPYLTPLGIASIMDVPIFLAGKFSGVLCCQHVGAPAHWTEEQRLFGAALANLVEIAEGHAELRKAQAELFESEQRLRALINGIPDQVWLKDAQGRYVAFNRGVEDAYGWAGQSLAGKSARDLLPLEEGKRITAEDLSVVASNQVLRAERLTWRTRRWVEVIKIPVVGADGRVSGLVGILRDISERKQIEAERRGRDREQRRVFVREIHHRIKNHMQGVSALLSQHMRRDPALAGVISGAITQLQSLAVVHGLQAMGPAGLPQLLEAICAAPQCSGEDTVPVDLVVHFGAKATINEDDAIPVALILNELLLNARKQSDRLAEARRVRVLLDSVPDGVCISIRNEGGLKRAGHEPGKQGGGSGLLMVRSLLPASGAEFEIHATAREVCASLILRPPVIVVEPSQASREDDPCLPANVLL